MRILITGATGLIGSAITAHCHENDIDVNYLTRDREGITDRENYRGFYWNTQNGEIDLDCFKGVSAIINLAGAPIAKRWTTSYKKTVLNSRIDSLRTLYQGLSKVDHSEIEAMVSASAIGIYPDSPTCLYTEDMDVNAEGFLADVVSHWEAEADTFKAFDFPVAKIRIGLVLSEKGGALAPLEKAVKAYAGAPLGDGDQWQSWIHIADLSKMFLFLIESQLEGTFNGVAPNPVTQKKLVNTLAKILEKPLLLPNVPEFILKTAMGEMSQVVLNSQRVSSAKIQDEGFTFAFSNLENALADLYTSPAHSD